MSDRIAMSSGISLPPLPSMPPITTDTATSNGLLSSNRIQLALMIGTPLVLGTGLCVYYYYHNRDNKRTNSKKIADNETDSADPFKRAMHLKTLGNKHFKDLKYTEAIDCYTKAINECPTDKMEDLSTFYQNRAASYEMLKKYREVVDDCDKAIQLNNRYVKALVRRAKALESLGDTTSALFNITAVCILEQFQNQTNLLTTDRLLREQSKVKAKALFKSRTPRLPSEHFISHYFMSYSNDPILKSCDPKDIVNHLETLRQKQTQSYQTLQEFLLLNGTIEILKGNIESGEKELEKVIALSDCGTDVKVNALIKLGTIKVQEIGREDSFNTALECFDRAVKLDEKNPDIYLHRAQIYLLSERVEEAYKDLELCCQLNDKFASAFAQKLYVQFRCGIRYNDESTVNKALKGFESAIKRFNESSELFSLYAQALMERGDFTKAEEYFTKAIEKDPLDGNLYVHKGILYLNSSNDVDKAVKLLEEAKDADPSCQFAYEMLGSIQVQKGFLADGIDHFDKALDLAQTELDCAHLYSLRDAAEAQEKATKMLGIELPTV
ncbi:unnamed protein product [Oppiella nova]|uniref:Mitochondrial import receptor subunit TOM70 n=1 Tax=Oppiella nova TaxID=334625 RepID=A0A7R9LMX8_9ACAR|nr:unnamed protein product [Oppiella nova]CAG2164555.1 unnamed protein product [Oppiella nova]